MVVFSDLDRSIIYSKKFLDDENKINDNICDIELYLNKNISYISKKTVDLIKAIKNNCDFIPTTTRTIDQYKRIEFFKYGLDFKYAITSNGGNLLLDGEKDLEYEAFISKKLKLSANINEVKLRFKEYEALEGIRKFKTAEDLFLYIVVDNKVFDISKLETFINSISKLNWNTYISGRKIYFLPDALKKSTAINYICDRFDYENTFSIGDSNMDKDMLDACKYSYVLAHGDLINYIKKEDKFILSKEEGFLGSEEILGYILSHQNKLNTK